MVGEGTAENRPRGPDRTTGIPPKETGAIPKTAKPVGEKGDVQKMDPSPVQSDYGTVIIEIVEGSAKGMKISFDASSLPNISGIKRTIEAGGQKFVKDGIAHLCVYENWQFLSLAQIRIVTRRVVIVQ